MAPLSKIWTEIDGVRQGQESSEMQITELLGLIEKTVLLIGQTNVACLYERRVNFMAKILRSLKVAKSTLSKNKDLLVNAGDVLFVEEFYKVLERKATNRKKARQMARDMKDAKKSRHGKPPFRSDPSGSDT